MANPTVYGPSYSTYVRATRLVLEEKGVPYTLVDVAMLAGAHQQPDYLKRNPFGKLPAFEHDGFTLYETGAIIRYIDRVFQWPKLQPTEAKALARMDQAMSILDSFAYGCMVGQLAWQRMVVPMLGGKPDEAVVAECLPRVTLCFAEFNRLLGTGPWFGGNAISLADLHLAPVIAYAASTSEGADLLRVQAPLQAWWLRMADRPSMARTAPQFG